LAIMPGGKLGGPALFKGLPSLFTVQWGATYLHVAHQISFPKIETLLQDFFGLAVDGPRIYTFQMMLADYYSPTVKRIIQNLVSGGVIYADETEIKLKKTKGYVWVLSNTEEVLYLYTVVSPKSSTPTKLLYPVERGIGRAEPAG
jgi:hypothetical protein